MKLFISADIEGCAGWAFREEGHKEEPAYAPFAAEMTAETVAVCEAAYRAGAKEIVVKDGHGQANNIDPLAMPDYVTLIRGKSGHPYNMMVGLDETFAGVMYIGYHAAAGDPRFAGSHTSTGNSLFIRLNGQPMSEFMLNTYTAATMGVPVLFLAGDEAICEDAAALLPSVRTVTTKRGVGGATFCVSRKKLMDQLEAAVKGAVKAEHDRIRKSNEPAPLLTVPEEFVYEVTFKDWHRAYKMSFYPGMEQVDTFTLRLQTKSWLEVVTAHSFIVY